MELAPSGLKQCQTKTEETLAPYLVHTIAGDEPQPTIENAQKMSTKNRDKCITNMQFCSAMTLSRV